MIFSNRVNISDYFLIHVIFISFIINLFDDKYYERIFNKRLSTYVEVIN